MIEFKVADAKHFYRGAENCRRGAGLDGAAATLCCEQSLRELEASWSFRGDTGAARRAPPRFGGIRRKKEGEPKIPSESTSKPRTRRYQRTTKAEARQVQRESRAAQSKLFPALRSKGCADGIRTWKQQPRVGGTERTGQMQAQKKEEEAIQEKR